MAEFVKLVFPWLVFISNVLFVFTALAYLSRNKLGFKVVLWLGKNALLIGFSVSLAAIVGSLSYSNIVGWEPCLLCIWQRIFIYPQVVLFAIALWKKDNNVFQYVLPLSIIAILISLYHINIQWGGFSVLPCSATGPSCDKVFSKEFGYITLPMMALSASLYIIVLAWAHRIYRRL